jgi:hypothetical protein
VTTTSIARERMQRVSAAVSRAVRSARRPHSACESLQMGSDGGPSTTSPSAENSARSGPSGTAMVSS